MVSARTDLLSAAESLAKKGQVTFSPAELIAEARERGSMYPDATLRTHIVSHMCVNAKGASAGTYPDLVWVSRGVYRIADSQDQLPAGNGQADLAVRQGLQRRVPPDVRASRNVEALIADFDGYLAAFEDQEVFEGPSLYFHLRALERRNAAPSAAALMGDQLFLEYLYAVLPSWGMHRMGRQTAKVPAFDEFAAALRNCESQIERLWHLEITSLEDAEVEDVGQELWDVIATLRSSTSRSRLVSGSKTLHHVLPALMPPIDRQYTFRFFTGQKAVYGGERASFLSWWPYLCEIGRRCAPQICAAVGRPEVMATSPSKVIDNAIVGFQLRQGDG